MAIYENIKKICSDSGISVSELEQKLNFARGSVYKWNEHSPSIEKVKLVADFFEVSIDYLLKE